jgi:hypothetical protein
MGISKKSVNWLHRMDPHHSFPPERASRTFYCYNFPMRALLILLTAHLMMN